MFPNTRQNVANALPFVIKPYRDKYYDHRVLTCCDHGGRPADDLAARRPRHALALVVVLAEELLHVVPGDVHHGLHVAHAGLRVHEVGDHGRHGFFQPVAVALEVHGERVRGAARQRGRLPLDRIRIHRLLQEYRQLDGHVQAGRRHRLHQRLAARQVRPLVHVDAAAAADARIRYGNPEARWNDKNIRDAIRLDVFMHVISYVCFYFFFRHRICRPKNLPNVF